MGLLKWLRSIGKRKQAPVPVSEAPCTPSAESAPEEVSYPKRADKTEAKPAATTAAQKAAKKAGTRAKQRIWVGLDFGTSATKVMFTAGTGAPVPVVCWEHGLPRLPDYCLPSLAAFDAKGRLQFGAEAAQALSDRPWNDGIRRMKMLLAGQYCERFRVAQLENEYAS